MQPDILDTDSAIRMVDEGLLTEALLVEEQGGWTARLQLGARGLALVAHGSHVPHVWHSLAHCIGFLKDEIRLLRFELLPAGPAAHARRDPDYEKWLGDEVQRVIDNPGPPIPNDEVERYFAQLRAGLRERMGEEPS